PGALPAECHRGEKVIGQSARVWGGAMRQLFRRLRQGVARVRTRRASQALILLYHRVAHSLSDPCLLCVRPNYFAKHLAVLRRHYDTIPLNEVAGTARTRYRGRRGVVLTFDDGYADNFDNARPPLERHDIPATVFVATGQVGSDQEFWWDELERLVLQ